MTLSPTGWRAAIVLIAALCATPLRARAQAPAPVPTAALVTAPSPQQAAQALAVLKDDARRAEMIGVLETLARAAPIAAPAAGPSGASVPTTPAVTAPAAGGVGAGGTFAPASGSATAAVAPPVVKLAIPLAPDSVGAQLLLDASDKLSTLSADVGDTVRTLTNFTLLERWAKGLAHDADSRAEVLDATWKLLVVAVIALAVEAALGRLTRRGRLALIRHAPSPDISDAEAVAPTPSEPSGTNVVAGTPDRTPKNGVAAEVRARAHRRARAVDTLRRLPLIVGRLLLDLIPVLAMGAAGYGLLGSRLGEPNTTKLVILALLNAYVVCRVITVVARALLSPDAPGLRLLPIQSALGWGLLRWVRRLAVIALFGYALTEVALLFGLYRVAHDALLKLVALVAHVMLAIMVVRYRAPVANLIRTAPGGPGVLAAVRGRIAAIWHVVVIFYILALWGVWALDVPGGFAKLLLIFVSTVAVASLARLSTVLLVAWLDHALPMERGGSSRTPGMDHTIRRYVPVLRRLLEILVSLTAVVVLLQIWGLESLAWFRADALGGRLASALLTSGVTIAIALAIWEGSNALTQNHLARLAREGQPARSARLRTLLPMLRTTLMVSISLFAGLTVLSQIGVNIAPLLAGAGVIGLAIGFGSQKLVQDIITGLFLLLENTMQVGDVITLAGLTGTVENLSIRTIRLRALDGSVHIVPFSAVTTVTNLTRDFAYAMLDISIGLNEEPDRVGEIIQDVADTMRRESRWGAAITDRMEIMGVERFIDTAWVLRCRIKTVPSQRWAVSRELNRRLKYRFDKEAIESPFTSYRALAAGAPPPPNAKTVDEPGLAAE